MKLLLIVLIGIFLCSSVSAISSCYQEFFNVSTSCGGLSTGVYSRDHNNWNPINVFQIYDGSFATFSEETTHNAIINDWFNYTTNSSFKTARYRIKNLVFDGFYEIPIRCTYNKNVSIQMNAIIINAAPKNVTHNISCYDNGWHSFITGFQDATYDNYFYEEAINWTYINTTNLLNFTSNIHEGKSDIYRINTTEFKNSSSNYENLTVNLYINNVKVNVQNQSFYDYSVNYRMPLIDAVNRSINITTEILTNVGGINYSLLNHTLIQQVNSTIFGICNSTLNSTYLNITFRNETSAAEYVSSSLTSTFYYWLENQSNNKSYIYTNITENKAYAFCLSPKDMSINLSMSGTYSNSYSQQRSFSNASMSLSNITTNYTLWLLPNSEGAYISFQVRTFPSTVISGALVTVEKSSDGTQIAQGYTDDTGIVSFWLDPTTLYTITVTKDGYTELASSITPTLTSYTLTITPVGGFSTELPIANVVEGISILIEPNADILSNMTSYYFNFIIGSVGSRLDSYGFDIVNSTGSILGSTSGSSSDGSNLSVLLNTGNNSYFVMRYYYIIDGNYSNNTRKWVIIDQEGTGWSILNFINDLKSYLNSSDGFFGIKSGTGEGDFTLAIFIFIVIFSFTGVMSYKYGLSGETVIVGLVFSAVLFFDVALGIVPNPLGVDNLPTIFTGAIFIILLLREVFT